MILIKLLFIFFALNEAEAKTKKIAIIDTGIDSSVGHLCKDGHKDFSNTSLIDTDGHGTHIAGLIVKNAGDADYCLINIKFFNPKFTGAKNVESMINSIKYAISQKVDYINISAGGPQGNDDEEALIKNALNQDIKIIAAAGNDGNNLNNECSFFPACYDDRIYVVGSTDASGKRVNSSNYGNIVKFWENGEKVLSNLPNNRNGYLSGTSQAAAIFTGKMLRKMSNM